MASLTKKCRHGRDLWDSCSCQWLIRRRVGGRDTYTPAGSDRVDAERALARAANEDLEPMSRAIDLWLRTKDNARPGTFQSCETRAAHVRAVFGRVLVRDVREAHVRRFIDDLLAEGYARGTVGGIYSALRSILRHAQRRGVIRELPLPIDPGIGASPPRKHDLTLDQAEQVIARIDDKRWRLVAELVLLTGLRWGEAVAIEPRDVEGRLLHVERTANRMGETNDPKTRAGLRVVPLSPRARAILGELDLPAATGLEYPQARKALVKAMGDLHQKGMGWHTLRNAHASLLDRSKVSLREAAARMGHGPHFAQTLAYGVRAEAGSADALDRVRRRHGASSSADPSRAPAQVERLDDHRSKRRRASP